tara:strand:- start:308 stop:670 length:363 start_codon:yes stop_codon:yes gene_type:complete
MAEDIFFGIRLAIMQNVLPIGIGMLERVRKQGIVEAMQVFNSSKEPFNDLRHQGEPVAESLRDQLDDLHPGLGNPVMPVNIVVDESISNDSGHDDNDLLIKALNRIEEKLELLNDAIDVS